MAVHRSELVSDLIATKRAKDPRNCKAHSHKIDASQTRGKKEERAPFMAGGRNRAIAVEEIARSSPAPWAESASHRIRKFSHRTDDKKKRDWRGGREKRSKELNASRWREDAAKATVLEG